MGQDLIVDTSNGDNYWKTGNTLTISQDYASGRTINLNSEPVLPEMTHTNGTGTANWDDNAIDNVDITSGGIGRASLSDTVVGNDVANYIDDGDPNTAAPPQNDADNDEVYYDDGDVITNCETTVLVP